MTAALAEQRAALVEWLRIDALPLWSQRGVDRHSGGFFEMLSPEGIPIEEPRRTRLVARQIYVFASAGKSGWQNIDTANELVAHGLDFLCHKSLSTQGRLYSAVAPTGEPIRPDFDLYDHAFALFGLATAAHLGHSREALSALGRALRDVMVQGFKHPIAGFEEAMPPRGPLNSSPHMHLLEAFLEWESADSDSGWQELSDDIAELALSRLIDAETGCIREHFTHDWDPGDGEPGRLLEPGHHCEWAWLLWRWAVARDRCDEVLPTVWRLTEIAERHGINEDTGLATNELWDDFTPRDQRSRLWPQTERIKANIAVAELGTGSRRELAVQRATAAAVGLRRYLDTRTAGLWHETLDEHGHPVPGPARASSLYHLVGAIRELDRFVNLNLDHG
jgi:mannose/cellobiose epimerase-like protein (N-acyl-D-glucosamine 2-epimerase family)